MNYLSFWNRYVLQSLAVLFHFSYLTCQSPQQSSLYWNFDSVSQVVTFQRLWAIKETTYWREEQRKGLMKNKTYTGRRKSRETSHYSVIWGWRKHRSWQWSITLIWAAAARQSVSGRLTTASASEEDKADNSDTKRRCLAFKGFVGVWLTKSDPTYQLWV